MTGAGYPRAAWVWRLQPEPEAQAADFHEAAVAAHPQLVSIIVPVLRGPGFDGLLIAVKSA